MTAVSTTALAALGTTLLTDAIKLAIQLLGSDSAKAATDAIFQAEEAAALAQADALAQAKFGA